MRRRAAAVGTFDGVHLGHGAVLDFLREKALEKDLEPIAITFDRHPLMEIAPQKAPKAISTLDKKCELIRSHGVEPIVMPFDKTMRATTALEWMTRMHVEMGVDLLVVGFDNTFGSDGVTFSVADYKDIGNRIGIEVATAPVVEGVSSSAVRKAIAAGSVEEAAEMLGRRYSLGGFVVNGNRLGRTIGFPTANMKPTDGMVIPGKGVYYAIAILPDGSRRMTVVNIGNRPTVRRGDTLAIEAHIIGWTGDIYGKPIRLSFVGRLRDEQKFNSIEELKRQIDKDVANARILLQNALNPKK